MATETESLPSVINPGQLGSAAGVHIPISMPPFHVPPPICQPRSQSLTIEELPQANTKIRMHDIVKEFDPFERLAEEVEDTLLDLADDFVEASVKAACLSAKHRKSNVIGEQDLQLHFERDWNMWLPGFGMEEIRPYINRRPACEAHKRRMAAIRKMLLNKHKKAEKKDKKTEKKDKKTPAPKPTSSATA